MFFDIMFTGLMSADCSWRTRPRQLFRSSWPLCHISASQGCSGKDLLDSKSTVNLIWQGSAPATLLRHVYTANRLSMWHDSSLAQRWVTDRISEKEHLAWSNEFQLEGFPIEVISDHAEYSRPQNFSRDVIHQFGVEPLHVLRKAWHART